MLSDITTVDRTNYIGLPLPSPLNTPENVECARKQRLYETTLKMSKDDKAAHINSCKTHVDKHLCSLCHCTLSGTKVKSAKDRNDLIPVDIFVSSVGGKESISKGTSILNNILSKEYYEESSNNAYCLRCCKCILCDECLVAWVKLYGKTVWDKKYSPRVVPKCPCCLSPALPNTDVAKATTDHKEADDDTAVTETPLFSLGDMIIDTCMKGSITSRFLSVLSNIYSSLTSRRHVPITNCMIKRCIGGVFIKKRNASQSK